MHTIKKHKASLNTQVVTHNAPNKQETQALKPKAQNPEALTLESVSLAFPPPRGCSHYKLFPVYNEPSILRNSNFWKEMGTLRTERLGLNFLITLMYQKKMYSLDIWAQVH